MTWIVEVPWLFRSVIRRLGQTSTVVVVITLLIGIVLVGAGLVTVEEIAAGGNGPKNYLDTLWWYTNTLTGLNLPSTPPVSQAGQATSAIVLLMARIFFGIFMGAVASALINRFLMEGRGMGSVILRHHVIICGWNSRGPNIVTEFLQEANGHDVVILANLDETPVRSKRVHFVRGDPSLEKDLQRASIGTAETAIILSDQSTPGLSDSTMDGRSVLITLTVHSLNKNIYIVAEVRQAENCPHFERAGADELLVTNDVVAVLLARAAANHGLTHVVRDLLTSDAGNEIFIVPLPPSLADKTFDEALMHLKTAHRALLIGTMCGKEIILNPKQPLNLNACDHLVLVCRDRPILD